MQANRLRTAHATQTQTESDPHGCCRTASGDKGADDLLSGNSSRSEEGGNLRKVFKVPASALAFHDKLFCAV